jgi:sugar lactone lactonase YvrE
VSSRVPSFARPRVLLASLQYVESPRWHEGRLWFAHWGPGEIVALDLAGRSEVVARVSATMGYSFDWLPDGRLLATGYELLRREEDGSMVPHADLSAFSRHGWNEIVVDGRGNVYVNSLRFDFAAGEEFAPGVIVLVPPDGPPRQVASGIAFPNRMVVTPDNSTLIVAESFAGCLTAFDIAADGGLSNRRLWAGDLGPDGICLDAEGAIWTATRDYDCVRVREGGEVLGVVGGLDRMPFACMLGGMERRTLFIAAAEWRGIENVRAALAARTGQVLMVEAPAPGIGWP